MHKMITLSALGLTLFSSPFVLAQPQTEIERLKAQLQQLTLKVKALEAKQQKTAAIVQQTQTSTKKLAWAERIKIKGDLRYRYENINDELERENERHRIRARIGAFAQVTDSVEVGIQLATGGDGIGTATSTNQDLDEAFGSKEISLDLAYFDWAAFDGFNLLGGKIKNPFFRPGKTPLLWDGDLRPEGLAFKYDNDQVFVNGGAFYIDEQSDDQDQVFLFGGQTGVKFNIRGAKVTTGIGYYHFEGFQGQPEAIVDDAEGNTLIDGNFENDFEEVELFAQIDFQLAGLPLSLFADFVTNTAPEDDANNGSNNAAYLVGFKVGNAKAPQTWDFAYFYEDIENDAVVGAFTDGDFAGGGTDGKGHVYKIGYAIDRNWKLGVTYFVTQENGQADDTNFNDFDRLQADIIFKF